MAREIAVYAHTLVAALRVHVSTLSYPNEPFRVPDGIVAFAMKAFQNARLEPVSADFIRQKILQGLDDQGILKRKSQGSHWWLLLDPASARRPRSTTTVAGLTAALRQIEPKLEDASLAELAGLASALGDLIPRVRRALEIKNLQPRRK